MISSSLANNDYADMIWMEHSRSRGKLIRNFLSAQVKRPVLDLGAGHGHIAAMVKEWGYEPVPVDGRPESIELIKSSYGLKAILCDLETDFPQLAGMYHTLVLGLIYHLARPEMLLERVARVSDTVIIDSICLDHDGVAIVKLEENPRILANSISGAGCRPSPGWIVRTMDLLGFNSYVDLSSAEMNVPPRSGNTGFSYDWAFERTCGWRRDDRQLRKLLAFTRRSSSEPQAAPAR